MKCSWYHSNWFLTKWSWTRHRSSNKSRLKKWSNRMQGFAGGCVAVAGVSMLALRCTLHSQLTFRWLTAISWFDCFAVVFSCLLVQMFIILLWICPVESNVVNLSRFFLTEKPNETKHNYKQMIMIVAAVGLVCAILSRTKFVRQTHDIVQLIFMSVFHSLAAIWFRFVAFVVMFSITFPSRVHSCKLLCGDFSDSAFGVRFFAQCGCNL